MAITNLPGKGTLLQIMVTATYYTIGQRVKLDGPDSELKTRDVTHLDSAMVSTRAAIPDPGTLSGTLLYDPNDSTASSGHPLIQAKLFTPPAAPDQFKLVYADGNTTPACVVFKALVTKWKVTGIEVESSLQVEFELRITDVFTITAGTP